MARFVVHARVVVSFTRTVEVPTDNPIDPRVIGAAEAAARDTGRRVPGALHETCGADFIGIDGDATVMLIEEPKTGGKK